MRHCRLLALVAVAAPLLAAAGCRSMYYSTMEMFGREKRHILVSQIEGVSEEQNKAAQEFRGVLTRLQVMSGFDGGDLENAYRKLRSDYEGCEGRARSVRVRITDMEEVAGDLFGEWEREITQISNRDLRSKSEEALRLTRQRYGRLDDAVNRAAGRMDPVLQQLKDYVLFLKHNLNAQAVGSLKVEADKIEAQVNQLIRDIQTSVGEAEEFLRTFQTP
jgi:hypothetical protein